MIGTTINSVRPCEDNYNVDTEEQFHNSDVTNKQNNVLLQYVKEVLQADLVLTQIQRKVIFDILELISKQLPNDFYKIIRTHDDEIQIFKQIKNGYVSLIIDEFGGITNLIMGNKGYGYSCNYFENERLDNKNKYILSKDFTSISMLQKRNSSSPSSTI